QLGMEAALGLTSLLKGSFRECFRKTLPSFLEVNESTGPPPDGPPRWVTGDADQTAVEHVGGNVAAPAPARS
ncbi:MAG: hypothetical protein KJ749_05485, partial [Planctomycetes bacterium]|nr:hypothetical protein [Planctomycetota bacterium]